MSGKQAAKKKPSSAKRPSVKPAAAKRRAPSAPSIVALLCENSAAKAYADALREGGEAAALLSCLEVVSLPCAGKVEVGLILRLLEKGCRGVLVAGCPKDNCTFIHGSSWAEKRVASARACLREAGLDENRVRMELVSSVDSPRLLAAVRDFKEYIDDHSRS